MVYGESGEEKPVPTEIVATVHPENSRSVRILEKTLKNKEADVFLKSSFDGKPRTLFYYSLEAKAIAEPDRGKSNAFDA